jgi:hypothetical protein
MMTTQKKNDKCFWRNNQQIIGDYRAQCQIIFLTLKPSGRRPTLNGIARELIGRGVAPEQRRFANRFRKTTLQVERTSDF